MEALPNALFAALSTQIVQSNREFRDEILAAVHEEAAAVRNDLRGEITAVGDDLRDEMYALHGITGSRLEKLERALAEGDDETRRFMKVLYEDLVSRITLLGEGR